MDIDTKRVYNGEFCSTEVLPDGTPLTAPVRFNYGSTGWYLSIERAEQLALELKDAAHAARVARWNTRKITNPDLTEITEKKP